MSDNTMMIGQHNITLFIDGKTMMLPRSSSHASRVIELGLADAWEAILCLLVPPDPFEEHPDFIADSEGRVCYRKDGATETVPPVLGKAIVEAAKRGAADLLPYVQFWRRLTLNPSYRAQQGLFDYITGANLVIDADGYFYAYKSLRSDLKDWYTGTIQTTFGEFVSLPRHRVDDSQDHDCSAGLHVGNYDYVTNFHPEGVFTLNRVDPVDVVAVPRGGQKIRVCRYLPLGIVSREDIRAGVISLEMQQAAKDATMPTVNVQPDTERTPLSELRAEAAALGYSGTTRLSRDQLTEVVAKGPSPTAKQDGPTLNELRRQAYGMGIKNVNKIPGGKDGILRAIEAHKDGK